MTALTLCDACGAILRTNDNLNTGVLGWDEKAYTPRHNFGACSCAGIFDRDEDPACPRCNPPRDLCAPCGREAS